MSDNLNSKKFYRFVLVLYHFFLIISFLVTYWLGSFTIPYKKINFYKSYIKCTKLDTQKSFRTLGISDENLALTLNDHVPAEIASFCKIPPVKQWTDQELINAVKSNWDDFFKVHYFYDELGSWSTTLSRWLKGVFWSYLILNLFQQTVLYIAYGRKFAWPYFLNFGETK
jgi:hypothetical protein